MKEEILIINIEGKIVECLVQRKKIKNVYIEVKDGRILIRVPLRLGNDKIKEIINSKKEWIAKRIDSKKESRSINLKNKPYIYILNKRIILEYVKVNTKKIDVKLNENECKVYIPQGITLTDEIYIKIEKKIEEKLRNIAKKYVDVVMEKYINLIGLIPSEIKIGKFKSMWGNCSSKKVIKINQKIIHYGIEQIEYVCLHEITHLKYMNHKKEFWNHVEKYMPNYKQISNVLK